MNHLAQLPHPLSGRVALRLPGGTASEGQKKAPSCGTKARGEQAAGSVNEPHTSPAPVTPPIGEAISGSQSAGDAHD
jgi:hypothetical protein